MGKRVLLDGLGFYSGKILQSALSNPTAEPTQKEWNKKKKKKVLIVSKSRKFSYHKELGKIV